MKAAEFCRTDTIISNFLHLIESMTTITKQKAAEAVVQYNSMSSLVGQSFCSSFSPEMSGSVNDWKTTASFLAD